MLGVLTINGLKISLWRLADRQHCATLCLAWLSPEMPMRQREAIARTKGRSKLMQIGHTIITVVNAHFSIPPLLNWLLIRSVSPLMHLSKLKPVTLLGARSGPANNCSAAIKCDLIPCCPFS